MAATLINSQTLYNQLLYINKQSNHPPTITKQLTSMISRRISDISCSKKYLDKVAPEYNNATKISDFYENIEFTLTIPPRQNRNKKKSYGSIHHIVSTWKETSVDYFYNSLTSTFHDIIITASYSIETILRSATVYMQLWQMSSETTTPVYWKTLSQLT